MAKAAANKIMKATSEKSPANAMSGDDMKYRAEDALRTLTRAEEYKADPQLMAHVEKCRSDQADALEKVKKHITVQSNEKKGKR